jgi:hypothetical protein
MLPTPVYRPVEGLAEASYLSEDGENALGHLMALGYCLY